MFFLLQNGFECGAFPSLISAKRVAEHLAKKRLGWTGPWEGEYNSFNDDGVRMDLVIKEKPETTFWVKLTSGCFHFVWLDETGKPFVFISEVQASELIAAWLKVWAKDSSYKYKIIPARSCPIN